MNILKTPTTTGVNWRKHGIIMHISEWGNFEECEGKVSHYDVGDSSPRYGHEGAPEAKPISVFQSGKYPQYLPFFTHSEKSTPGCQSMFNCGKLRG